MTLRRAKGIILCKKKADLQTFLKLIATIEKEGKLSGVCGISPLFPENNLYVSKESSFPIPSKYTRREAYKNQFGHFGREPYR